ncbi:MAG: hypothetical protein EPO21_14840 [Chloroflexota bacterium]|nr:MAG: hypothetical protein EPO21_14840 [Chloroflexota bacterium]
MAPTDFSIKLNNCASNDPCAVCGERTDPQVGPELFLADTWRPICRRCGYKHAPELTGILDAAALRASEKDTF